MALPGYINHERTKHILIASTALYLRIDNCNFNEMYLCIKQKGQSGKYLIDHRKQ